MSKPIFVPTAVPVENVALTPDPDNPHGGHAGFPGGERPFDWRLDFPLRAERFRFCDLNLRAGCYQLFLQRTDAITVFSDRFEGTLRVEKDRNDTTVSGDLYKIRRLDDILIERVQRGLAARQPIIPIKARSRYFSYLRVIGIETTPVLTQFARIEPPIFNLCTIRLTVEEFRYTHPTAGQANGSFPETPTRTLVFVLTKAAVRRGSRDRRSKAMSSRMAGGSRSRPRSSGSLTSSAAPAWSSRTSPASPFPGALAPTRSSQPMPRPAGTLRS